MNTNKCLLTIKFFLTIHLCYKIYSLYNRNIADYKYFIIIKKKSNNYYNNKIVHGYHAPVEFTFGYAHQTIFHYYY